MTGGADFPSQSGLNLNRAHAWLPWVVSGFIDLLGELGAQETGRRTVTRFRFADSACPFGQSRGHGVGELKV